MFALLTKLSIALIALCLAILTPANGYAAIYCYKDDQGRTIFTDHELPNRGYKLLWVRGPITPKSEFEKNKRKYDHHIREAARRNQVDPALVKAVIHAESAFNKAAVSVKGAQGLMQLMPATASELRVKNPFDARENIMGGTQYLTLMMQQFKGNADLALAAYNAGPNAVEKYGGIPPYAETKNYVVKVNKLWRQYKSEHL